MSPFNSSGTSESPERETEGRKESPTGLFPEIEKPKIASRRNGALQQSADLSRDSFAQSSLIPKHL